MPEIACIGEAMVELALDPARPDSARVGFAGDTLNTAIYLKRCAPDLPVSYVTRLGRDAFSARMLEMMAREGLATDLIGLSDDRRPGLYAITTDAAGERSFSYWRDRSAARELFDQPPRLEALARFDVIYLSAITLAILSPDARAALIAWLPGFRAAGGRVAFDSNHRPALWPDPGTERAAVAALWAECDIALPGLEDEMAIFGDPDEATVLARLRAAGIARGAIKRGDRGPLSIAGDTGGRFPRADHVVDSTAAGDSFNGAYLAACLAGRPEPECLAAGHALALRVLAVKGAILSRENAPC